MRILFTDGPVCVEMVGMKNLPDESYKTDTEIAAIWSSKGETVSGSIKLFNKDFINGSFTYDYSNLYLSYRYKYYRPVFYFADGTATVGDIIYR